MGGRGRGYTGRNNTRMVRPGDVNTSLEDEPNRKTMEVPTRTPVPTEPVKTEVKKTDPPIESKEDHVKVEPRPQLSPEDEAVILDLVTVDDKYTPLLVLLEQFSPGEDGIHFNQKLKHFEATITSLCPDETFLQEAFASFRAAALQSGATSRKLAAVGASFTRQQRQQVLRTTLLNVVMQGTYSKLEVLEKGSPQLLINAANLMGDYFSEARLSNGSKVHILAAPLLHYLKALLNSNDNRAHRSLATQLMQNGRELITVLPHEVEELSISIRRRLLKPFQASVVWLLLSADLCINKFLPLPTSLQKFYASHLELSQDQGSFSEVNYGSWKKPDEEKSDLDSSLTEQVSLNLSLDENGLKPKLRPILGAGAGLLRQEHNNVINPNSVSLNNSVSHNSSVNYINHVSVSQDTYDTWQPKTSKRHDLNSWRQNVDNQDDNSEPVFDPTVLPPNLSGPTVIVPDYPPPNIAKYNIMKPKDNFNNYLQLGDGNYIQNQFTERPPSYHGDGYNYQNERVTPEKASLAENSPEKPQRTENPLRIEKKLESPTLPERERMSNEVQKTSARKPVENWRKEKPDLPIKDDRKPRWNRQRSSENLNEEEGDKDRRGSRSNIREVRVDRQRRESIDNDGKDKPRRHVTEVPRSHKYWDHDDRCDIDYNS